MKNNHITVEKVQRFGAWQDHLYQAYDITITPGQLKLCI